MSGGEEGEREREREGEGGREREGKGGRERVREREGERGREKEGEREGGRGREREGGRGKEREGGGERCVVNRGGYNVHHKVRGGQWREGGGRREGERNVTCACSGQRSRRKGGRQVEVQYVVRGEGGQ